MLSLAGIGLTLSHLLLTYPKKSSCGRRLKSSSVFCMVLIVTELACRAKNSILRPMTEVKPGAFFDVDGTIFKSSLLEKLVDEGVGQGIFTHDAFEHALKVKDEWQKSNNEGAYVAYLDLLVGSFVNSITGVSVATMQELTDDVVTNQVIRRFRFPQVLMRMTNRTHTNVVVSGSPEFAVRRYVSDLAPHLIFGSSYEVTDGQYTGRAESVGDKAKIRRELIKNGIILAAKCIAIGDTMSDKSILGEVDVPIMLNPSNTLANYGKSFGWPIVIEQKDNITVLEANENADGGYDYKMTSQTHLLDKIETQLAE